MTPIVAVAALFVSLGPPQPRPPSTVELARWEREVRSVTIIRDNWGIAHVYGKTDADAVFGMEYAQAEDDFNRVETNYLNSLGWLARAEGPSAVFQDLRQQLFIDTDSLKAGYAASPAWLKKLMDAFADGLNFYLYKHPDVKPRAITHFEPWMALSFTEGSIGGDIERVNLGQLAAFYGDSTARPTHLSGDGLSDEPTGSNGIAVAPSRTLNHHAILWINPHTSFYFRSELQMVSDEGLDAYGAATWGQFFIYQGFNAKAGWMHTSSGVDNIDEFLETVTPSGSGYTYRHGGREYPVATRAVTISYATPGGMGQRTFTTYFTRHGPAVRRAGDKWVTVSLMQSPVNALIQSYGRTKAKSLQEFEQFFDLHTNSSNNTVFADAQGDIAYFHSNYIPRRDTALDWTRPVDGSDSATDYHGVLSVEETPSVVNPPSGWLYNSNNWPWSAAGPDSPHRDRYPRYVETGTEESARGYHALRVLPTLHNATPDSVIGAAFDSYLPAFERLIPALLKAYDQAPADSLKARVAEQIGVLRAWDYRWGAASVPTSLAVFWGEAAMRRVFREARAADLPAQDYIVERASGTVLLEALAQASDTLTAGFGSWRTPWGEINRFQRVDDSIASHFDDTKPSIPVPFTSSLWGSLASFGARPYSNTKRWYGSSGNSFVAVVEFGDSVRARAVTAGGESGNTASAHFNDEAERYASGNLREVYYYRSQLKGHTEREYHPGE
ncbi:MAG TPA: penicillin acylase family protein [Gemmatimonadales bacterium]|jgi:acyl-homoserine-lactone acylase|nr:penicillin acylase family protein [Gemmatimonadales bacterium]